MNIYILVILTALFLLVVILTLYFLLNRKINIGKPIGWLPIQEKNENAVLQVFSVTSVFNWIEPFKLPVQITAAGSGFFINDQGYFITNSHVVDQAKSVWIHIPGLGRKNIDADIISVCPDRDLALLRIRQEGINDIVSEFGKLPYLSLGNSDNVKRTDKILVLGYPLGRYNLKSTTGIVSGRESFDDQYFIQIDAAINPGSSGGPVLNENGEVVGISTASIPLAQNIGFVIPINELKNILEDLNSVSFLRKQRLGISFNSATPEQVEFLKNPQPGGFYVNKVYKNSIASKVGIEIGDMIYKINGIDVDIFGEANVDWSGDKVPIYEIISRFTSGQDVSILLYRLGQEKEIKFKFENAPIYPIRLMYPEYEKIDYEVIAGLIVMELSENHILSLFEYAPELIKYIFPENQTEPVLIVSYIFPGSDLYRLRIFKIGSIIKNVNGVPIKSLDDFRQALGKSLTTGYLTITDSKGVFIVLNISQVLKDEFRLARDYKYQFTPMVRYILEALKVSQSE